MIVLAILALGGLVVWNVRYRRQHPSDAGPRGERQKMRPLTQGILIFNALMLVWFVAAVGTAGRDCQSQQFVEQVQACEAGAGIGGAFILVLAALGDVVLGVIWLVTRKTPAPERTCPVCGSPLAIGLTVCPTCGHDFRQSATMPPSPGPKAE